MDAKTFLIFKEYTELYETNRFELKETIAAFEAKNIFLKRLFVDNLEKTISHPLNKVCPFCTEQNQK